MSREAETTGLDAFQLGPSASVFDPAGHFVDHWPDSLDEETVVPRLGKLLV